MNHKYVILLLTLLMATMVTARTKTTQAGLRTAHILVEPIPATVADSTATSATASVDQNLITLRGFNKRKGDARESFLITNNASHRISNPRITLRYSTLDGGMIHERTVTVPIALNPGETRMAEVKTFDVQHTFYYYAGPAPRKNATPFKVAFRLVGYDIPVGL
ncbi:MAG: hypothetical protein J6I72_03595 [Muribaculaceae bacterium]|nr:hypothetical protein [Muribaculaceae bacterium]